MDEISEEESHDTEPIALLAITTQHLPSTTDQVSLHRHQLWYQLDQVNWQ